MAGRTSRPVTMWSSLHGVVTSARPLCYSTAQSKVGQIPQCILISGQAMWQPALVGKRLCWAPAYHLRGLLRGATLSHLITGSCSGRKALSGVTEPNKVGCADLHLTGRGHGAVLYWSM